MDVGDKTVNLVATKLIDYKDKQGQIWYRGWHLKDVDTHKVYGLMVYNSHWTDGKYFSINIYNPIHPELGCYATRLFRDKVEALTWAREQIENMREPTYGELEQALENIREWRYQDEMADDFAYSNGKIARWDSLERQIRTMLDKVA